MPKSGEVARATSGAKQKPGKLQKTDSLPTTPSQYRQLHGVLPECPPPDNHMTSGYLPPAMSPAEMALRGMSPRHVYSGHDPQVSLAPSPSMGIRPAMPPPAPPSATPTRALLDTSRSSLPPPPPTPQDKSTVSSSMNDRHSEAPLMSSMNSPDLPAPPAWQQGPSAVSVSRNNSINSPASNGDQSTMSLPSPPPFLPPPPLAFGVSASGDGTESYWDDSVTPSITSDVISECSSRTDDIAGSADSQQPMVRDTRCDLLSAIREG